MEDEAIKSGCLCNTFTPGNHKWLCCCAQVLLWEPPMGIWLATVRTRCWTTWTFGQNPQGFSCILIITFLHKWSPRSWTRSPAHVHEQLCLPYCMPNSRELALIRDKVGTIPATGQPQRQMILFQKTSAPQMLFWCFILQSFNLYFNFCTFLLSKSLWDPSGVKSRT